MPTPLRGGLVMHVQNTQIHHGGIEQQNTDVELEQTKNNKRTIIIRLPPVWFTRRGIIIASFIVLLKAVQTHITPWPS
jgi:hypothetical protein